MKASESSLVSDSTLVLDYRLASRAQRREPQPYLSHKPGLRGHLLAMLDWIETEVLDRLR